MGSTLATTREGLKRLLGIVEPTLRLVSSRLQPQGSDVLEVLTFETDSGERIRGFLSRPSAGGPFPAIVYAHAHGGRYDIGASEFTEGRPALLGPLAPVFSAAGYATLCIDMPTFGDRASLTESAASKALLWYGRSLFGQMLSEQAAVVTYLQGRDDVDAARIGMFGISMGATLAYWLAAVDERIAAIAHLCCYADFATLIEMNLHDQHGIYLTVPGLLSETSTGEIAGFVSPRPQLICLGEADSLTPPLAIDRALVETRSAYGDGPLELLRQPGVGHEETPEMRKAVFDFFARTLKA